MELTMYQKQNLKNHKYNHNGMSFLDQYLNIYWNFCIKFVPKWISPNFITLWGLLTNLIPIIIILCYYKFDTTINVWFYCLFDYIIYRFQI